MSKTASADAVKTALAERVPFETIIAKLSPKDRLNVERHLTAAAATPGHAELYKRLVSVLATLSPHSVAANGQQSLQFFIADGKYRMQVSALEDLRDGKITVYTGDCTAEAVKAGVIAKPARGANPPLWPVGGKEGLHIEQLDGKYPNPAAFYKNLLGWNRKALRVVLPTNAPAAHVSAVEILCGLAAKAWTK